MNFIKKFVRILLGTIFSILGAAGWLFQTLLQVVTIALVVCLAAGVVVLIKVQPQLARSREVAYDVLAQMEPTDFSMLSDTEIFDKNGNRIGLINAGHYEYVDISNISMNLQNAYIAQEDRRFKTHNGVDWIATVRAGLALIKHKGVITQGGSTITQQVIKNTYLTQEQTFTRKMVEILLAPEIEKTYSKADIMEFYCNTNFYGHHCYGVQAASRYYFGKTAAELDVHEAAVLVGISNSPSAYDPVTHPEASLKKRNEVLKSMLEVDMLSEEEYKEALIQPLHILQEQQEGTDDSYLTSYAVHCAALELMKKENFPFRYTFTDKQDYDSYIEQYTITYNEKNDLIRNGGYQIYTTLDQDIQAILQTQLDETLASYTELQENGKYALQGAAVIVDNQTNYVVAIVGGRGTEDPFNRAYLSARQPGSTIKPLIDYGPAFDTGEYYPSRIINDHHWENGPANSGGRYYGPVTVREALNRSLNTVAWQVLEDIGVDTGLSYLDSMEFHRLTYVDNGVSSLSIGGFTNGVRVVDMAKGFSTLANYGVYNDNTCILRIEHEHEGVVSARSFAVTKQVYSNDAAFMLTDILKGTLTTPYGTGRALGLSGGMPAAGKTGTTNSSKDTWFCGYTRYYTTAVWVGYDTPRAMPGIYGSTYAGVIWKNVMNQLHENLEPWDWEQPETVVKDSYDPVTGARLHSSQVPVSREEAQAIGLTSSTPVVSNDTAHNSTEQEAVYYITSLTGPGMGPGPDTSSESGSPTDSGTDSGSFAGPQTEPSGPAGPGVGLDYSGGFVPPRPSEPQVPIGPGVNLDPGSSSETEEQTGIDPVDLPSDFETDPAKSSDIETAPAEIPPEEQHPNGTAQDSYDSLQISEGTYLEPTARAGTNRVDYFSTRFEELALQNITAKAQKKLIEELESLISAFETETIRSAADVYKIRSQHKEITEKLNQLESGEERKKLYDRTEARWEKFSTIIDSMSEAIRVYEEQQELIKQQKQRKAEEQAALDRQQQELQDRISSFEIALGMLDGIQYQSSDSDSLIAAALAKYNDLIGYTDTEPYHLRLEAALQRLRLLPRQGENEPQAQAEENSQETLQPEGPGQNLQSYGPGGN